MTSAKHWAQCMRVVRKFSQSLNNGPYASSLPDQHGSLSEVLGVCAELAIPMQALACYQWEAGTPGDVVQLCVELGLPGKLLKLCTWLLPVACPEDLGQRPDRDLELPSTQEIIYTTWFAAYRTLVAMCTELKFSDAQDKALMQQLMGGNSGDQGQGQLGKIIEGSMHLHWGIAMAVGIASSLTGCGKHFSGYDFERSYSLLR